MFDVAIFINLDAYIKATTVFILMRFQSTRNIKHWQLLLFFFRSNTYYMILPIVCGGCQQMFSSYWLSVRIAQRNKLFVSLVVQAFIEL